MKLQLSFDRVAGYPIVSTPLPDVDIKGCKEAVLKSLELLSFKEEDNIGTQMDTNHFMDPSLLDLFKKAYDVTCFLHSHFLKTPVEQAYQNTWVLALDPNENYTETEDWSGFHQHTSYHKQYTAFTNYTWTYYIQKPNNCIGDEGKLSFKRNLVDESIEYVDIEENHLYLFPATAWHQPHQAPNSTVHRIVAAGNVHIPNQERCFLHYVD